jgi:ArsR family transcriptional regulator, arsenate/arsenite/antimonite-responsive transcriptional repressor / arsenate reductase (thioredoxin)
MTDQRLRVLFLCTGNAARSQMAEALLRELSKGRIDAFSAGSVPQQRVHSLAAQTLAGKFGIDISGLFPKPVSRFQDQSFDYIITVCDRLAETCPTFPGDPERIHWSFEDPAAVEDPESQRRAFEHVAAGLSNRIRLWLALPGVRSRTDAVSAGSGTR